MTYETLTLNFDGPVAVITIARPQVLNALDARVLDELDGALGDVAANPAARALVITGAG
ncbi:MAG TPA: enoyl-CoA hydratase-related protein, partial [Myxococcota bacterium]|nr:enoyl-CoA hydratase-related protein [Myxococcota bacterium]